jgi:mRNA-degrading endonuclease HigB of HigAB toxin-antitoxin module
MKFTQKEFDAVENVKCVRAEEVSIAWHNDEIISITGNEKRVAQIKQLLKIEG